MDRHPDGFTGLPQDEVADISDNNQFFHGGRIDQAAADQAAMALEGIDAAAKTLLAFSWLLTGTGAVRRDLAPVLKDAIEEATAGIRADLKELEMSGRES